MIYHHTYGVGRARKEHWTKTCSIHSSGPPEGVTQRHKSRIKDRMLVQKPRHMRMRRGATRSTFHARAPSARSSNHFCARAVCATPESSLFERARAQDVHLDGVREPGATVDICQRAQGRIGRGKDLWTRVKDSGEDHLLASSSPGSHGRWPPSPKSIADTTSGSDANARWPARARQKVRPARTASGSGQAHHGTRKGRGRRGGEGRSKVSAAAARWARRWQKWAHFRSSSAGQAPDFPPSPHR